MATFFGVIFFAGVFLVAFFKTFFLAEIIFDVIFFAICFLVTAFKFGF